MLDAQDRKDIAELMHVIVESEITPKLNLLVEGQQTLLETLAPKSRVEALEEEVDFLKSISLAKSWRTFSQSTWPCCIISHR